MYTAILMLLLLAGGLLIGRGIRCNSTSTIFAGVAVVIGAIAFFALLSFWGELLWFEAIGYEERFWTLLVAKFGAALVAVVFGFLIIYLLNWPLHQSTGSQRPSLTRSSAANTEQRGWKYVRRNTIQGWYGYFSVAISR